MLFVTHMLMVALGIVLTLVVIHAKRDGTLHINTYDPDTDVYSFEFDIPIDQIGNRHMIVFNVKVDSQPKSHEKRAL